MSKRQLKFRAWDTIQKTMYFFDLKGLYNEGIEFNLANHDPKHLAENTQIPYEGMDIMQYCGLKDSYEGDVFGVESVQYGTQAIGYVSFDTDLGAFVIVKTNGGWEFLNEFLDDNKTVKIIGNIYENPELLNP